MLSIGKLVLGAEDYYLRSVARGQEEYYLGSGEAPGYWIGSGASRFGLAGEVIDNQLHRILSGCDPHSGEPLGLKQTSATRVAGFDLTFSAPKSVSILYGLGEEELPARVTDAHDRAVASAITYLERHALYARRGAAGVETIATEGITACAFRHRTSREGDPQLHTHVLVANLVKATDARYSSLHAKVIYRHSRTAGFIYQAVLRNELSQSLGVNFTPVTNGIAEIKGIGRELIEAFSTRRREIMNLLDSWQTHSPKAAQLAALETRKPKHLNHPRENDANEESDGNTIPLASDQVSLRDTWIRRAREHGLDPTYALSAVSIHQRAGQPTFQARPSVIDPTCIPSTATANPPAANSNAITAPYSTPYSPDKSDTISDAVAHLLGEEGLCAHDSSFEIRDAYREAAALFQQGASLDMIETIASGCFASNGLVPLTGTVARLTTPTSPSPAVAPTLTAATNLRYTTRELLRAEQQLLDTARNTRASAVSVVDEAILEEVISTNQQLSEEQLAMLKRLTGSGDGVEVVLGHAGAGKTYGLRCCRQAYERQGYTVYGYALSARAALELSGGAGIESATLASLQEKLFQGMHPFRKGDVVVVDEAGMVGTRMLGRVIAEAAPHGAKVVLVGDDRQLPEIASGGAFGALARALEPSTLAANRRQEETWEKDALKDLRHGDLSQALRSYDDKGRIHFYENAATTKAALVSDWYAGYIEEGRSSTYIYTVHNKDVDDLNDLARSYLKSTHILQDDIYRSRSGCGFAAGDEVMCVRNDPQIGVVNGERGIVTEILSGKLAVQMKVGIRLIDEPYVDAGFLRYGYASTIHKSQGATIQRAFVYATNALYREAGYVAMSRARVQSDLYVVNGSFETGVDFCDDVTAGYHDTIVLSGTLGVSRAKHMATDEMDRIDHLPDHLPDHPPTVAEPAGRAGIPQPARLVEYDPALQEIPEAGHVPHFNIHSSRPHTSMQPSAPNDPKAPYLTDLIGPRPDCPDERPEWDRVAFLIKHYRRMAGVNGEAALGRRPLDKQLRIAYNEAMDAIVSYDRRRGRELALEPPSRGLGFGGF